VVDGGAECEIVAVFAKRVIRQPGPEALLRRLAIGEHACFVELLFLRGAQDLGHFLNQVRPAHNPVVCWRDSGSFEKSERGGGVA
jgi:hypothetical protein